MEKRYKVLFADSVLCDFKSISSKYLERIIEKVELLESFPELGVVCRGNKWEGYRQLIVDFYRILYKVDHEKKIIHILYAKHGKMDIH